MEQCNAQLQFYADYQISGTFILTQTRPGLFRRGGIVLTRHLQTETHSLIDSHTLNLAIKSNTKTALDFDPFS